MYGKGISREGSLIDMSVDLGIVKKSGAWFTYEGEQLGQGRENAKTFLIENPEVMMEISDKVLTAAGLKPGEGEEAVVAAEPSPVSTSRSGSRRPTTSRSRSTEPNLPVPPGSAMTVACSAQSPGLNTIR